MNVNLADTDTQPASDAVVESTTWLYASLHDWLAGQYFGDEFSRFAVEGIALLITLVAAFLVFQITHVLFGGIVRRIVRRTRTKLDDFLIEQRFFKRLAHLAPATVIYYSTDLFPPEWSDPVERFAMGYMVIVATLVCTALLRAVGDAYGTLEISHSSPIKAFVQTANLFVVLIGGIFLLSVLLDKSPWRLVASIGAVTAVLLLIFKDSILGLVASIQIIINDLVHLGDWVELPQYGADGDVIDITLTTVKIQNWDKTVSTIPTYALISDSFRNWRGMQESGGRRIKRSLLIDMNSVAVLTDEMLARFEKFELLKDYIQNRQKEVARYNDEHSIDTTEVINGRRLTNIGTFRAYVKEYLRRHPKIHPDMTFLVRHLPSTEMGLPLEIYVFSSDQNWVNYEEIQADIFDHLLSVVPEFGLRIFQNPSGSDFRSIAQPVRSAA